MKKQFLEYAIPSALAMCIASFNTVLDGVFLGRGIGDLALAAVNIVMPLTIVFFGLATMVAVGGGAIVSKNFGAKNDERAVNVFRQVMKFLVVISLILSVICVIFASPIVKLMGATENLQDLSAEYLRYYAMFCIPNLLGIALGSFVRNDNRPNLAMIATIAGTICNVALNYIFIFELKLGVKSAAIATGLGQIVTVLIITSHFISKKGKLTFGKSKMEKDIITEAIKVGFPSFVAEAAFSVMILIHNIVITFTIGEMGLSAYAVVNYITTNIYLILLGVTLGAQPLMSYNFGAKDADKIINVYGLAVKTSMIISAGFFVICLFFGKPIIGIFTSDKTIIDMSYIALNMTNLAYFLIGKNLTTTVYYQAIEFTKYSNLIGALRSILVLPIILIVFSKVFGANGIWVSMFVTELITMFIIAKIANIQKYAYKAVAD
ncbi:MATE family efflux transporter [[Clostridium] dakarense]|uniref:MATE family efflux transporter n=1 Tax=Faecalimicrobium dakarense TaxID=1301100 RepID=UPI0004AE051F|nr:MATE family efflux transporter [[Clostridium] dakarense]